MDIYDPQTLGVMVFGGFMVISAIGIFLVSTFSMKETSYEEALAKQRREQEKAQLPKSEKKKKEKSLDKKGKSKKKDDKPNGKLPSSEAALDVSETVSESEPENAVPEPVVPEPPVTIVRAPVQEQPAPSPKDKKKKEKKVAKVEPAPSPASAPVQAQVSKNAPVLEAVAKEVPVMAVPPVGAKQSVLLSTSPPTKKADVVTSHEDVKQEKQEIAAKKKAGPKKKSETASIDSLDSPIYLPFKTLLSTVSSMVFSEGEAQRLIEILTDKAGIVQGTWHTATQKGDPVTALKKQLEEKEKLLSAEQEDAAAAKNKLRELTKELNVERSKVAAAEAKMKEQLTAKEQEIKAMQDRMQASYQDHVNETQQLQTKIRSLQEQLENGPNAQLARLQQENSILRDALNQATSQMESKQNAELAKLRQECTKLTKDLGEKSDAFQKEEQQRKVLEAKAAAFEKQIGQLQSSQQETEATLQKRLDELGEELRKSQSRNASILADLDNAKQGLLGLTELQAKVAATEVEVKLKSEEVGNLQNKLSEADKEKKELEERIRTIEALLEAGHSKEAEKDYEMERVRAEEQECLQNSLKEKETQISYMEKELLQLKETVETQKNKNNDLREKNWNAMEALTAAEKSNEGKLCATKAAKDLAEQQLCMLQKETREVLQVLFPQVSVATDQPNWLEEFKQKAQESVNQQSATATESMELALKLKEAEASQSTLQAECEQYRNVLAETEGMLKDLQKSVEEEELVWKAKLSDSEDELNKLKMQLSLVEAQLEKQLESAQSECQNYSDELEALRHLLCESQSQLEMAKSEAQKQTAELALVRQHLGEMKSRVEDGQAVGSQTDQTGQVTDKLQSQLEKTIEKLNHEHVQNQTLAEEFEQAQTIVSNLQAELDSLKAAGGADLPSSENIAQLKIRLEKEKKLSKDLGQAAVKLQQLLRTSQEQLYKEKEVVKKLQEQLEGKAEGEESLEGTSV
ncbi:ribosome-binding protein 1-like isoform X1 [Erpetoichthys calabaricus]|uniref:ribosome-binding protein 1-like isoform X1 n=1 Tax=Erpetoichthys calabaricus TaxID=27687 RepID=UPI00223461E1|nr:ribosome-binding protein 1-like isoform X1 [Erpetoichthys calabaricus]